MTRSYPEIKASHGPKKGVTAFPIPGDTEGIRKLIKRADDHVLHSWKNDQLSRDAVSCLLTLFDLVEQVVVVNMEEGEDDEEYSEEYKLLAVRVQEIAEMNLEDIEEDCSGIIETLDDLIDRLK